MPVVSFLNQKVSFTMAYERIEAISKSLGDARINIRLRSATNLLEKLEIGVIDKEAIANSASLSTLLSGVHKAIALILENPDDLADRNKESNDLLQALLSIVRETVKDSSRSNSLINISTKILEQLYFLKEADNIVGTVKAAIDEVRSRTTPVSMELSTTQHTFPMSIFSYRPSALCVG